MIPYFKNRNRGREASLQYVSDHREQLVGALVGALTKATSEYYGEPAAAPGA